MTTTTPEAPKPSIFDEDPEPISLWFGLSYCSYLVLPRVLMEHMPVEWQRRMVRLLVEAQDQFPGHDTAYRVHAVDPVSGRYVQDELANYRRPNESAIAEVRHLGLREAEGIATLRDGSNHATSRVTQ